MIAHVARLAVVLAIVAVAWLFVGQVVRAADSILPGCGHANPTCATPGNTPNR